MFRHRPRTLCSRIDPPLRSAKKSIQTIETTPDFAKLNLLTASHLTFADSFARSRLTLAGDERHRLPLVRPPILIGHQDRGRYRDRGIRPDQDSNHQVERETMQHLAADQVQS